MNYTTIQDVMQRNNKKTFLYEIHINIGFYGDLTNGALRQN